MVSSNQFNKRSIVVVVYLWLVLINKNDLASFNIIDKNNNVDENDQNENEI